MIPVDDKGDILLPQTTIQGELWPILLTKALLKIISLEYLYLSLKIKILKNFTQIFLLSFNPSDSASEFNDANVITCLTGWLPEPLPLRFGHMSEVWKFLKDTLPKFQWPDDKPKNQLDDDQTLLVKYINFLIF